MKEQRNPRSANGNLRRKHRARFKAIGGECGICKGRLGPIHYNEPSDSKHPLSFVIDEIKPVSRWREFGYNSREAAAQDWNNLQPAHYCCNAAKSNKTLNEMQRSQQSQNERYRRGMVRAANRGGEGTPPRGDGDHRCPAPIYTQGIS